MTELEKALMQVNDDYLIGMANKGIVKRAYKDKEETKAKFREDYSSETEVSDIQIGNEMVKIRLPLAESSCSCPSRSVCRHIVLGILLAKERIEKQDIPKAVEVENTPSDQGLIKEIQEYPVEVLQRKMGRHYTRFLNRLEKNRIPEITGSNVYTIELDESVKVSLLSPLEYSTCSCHKKELCEHKAEAILWCKFVKGMVKREELDVIPERSELTVEEIRKMAGDLKQFLVELIVTGISRTSQDRLEYLERLSVQAHSAGLANMEKEIRTLSEIYRQYFKKMSSFRQMELIDHLLRQYRGCECFLEAEEGKVSELAGQFKTDYYRAGTLHLQGVALESFQTKNGYHGVTVYFLDVKTQEWYTYTIARPVIYDTSKQRRETRYHPMPWGIPLGIGDSIQLDFILYEAKCDERNRLSSSTESRAEIRKKEFYCPKEENRWFFSDFKTLFSSITVQDKWIRSKRKASGSLYVFLQPSAMDSPFFDEAGQTLYITLYDRAGREVILELLYSKKSQQMILSLEEMKPEKPCCLFGEVYLKDGRIHFRPISMFDAVYIKDRSGKKEKTNDSEVNEVPKIFCERIAEGEELIEEIFHSGFTSITSGTLEKMTNYAEKVRRYGLKKLSGYFVQIHELLEQRKHQIKHTAEYDEQIISLLAATKEYLYLGQVKAAYDLTKGYYL